MKKKIIEVPLRKKKKNPIFKHRHFKKVCKVALCFLECTAGSFEDGRL